jgi:Na+-driven multidrug efflux pump
LRFLGPLMLSNVLQALSGTINNVYLGQLIGVHALAACTAFFPIQFFGCIANSACGQGVNPRGLPTPIGATTD